MGNNYVDLSGVYRRIEDVRRDLRNAVDEIRSEVNAAHRESMKEIEFVQNQLIEMERSARLRDALQRALTEIIRVRQELEDKFGSHKLVREYMLGILQANDLGLITKTTISKCTEELMISAPGYWLAPALIALAGWISDNRTLAERALKVAMERDEEKTSLLFALITRRVNAGRIQAGGKGSDVSFQWLNRYFALQDPSNMKESVVAYIDAYSNHIFGEDVDHICDDHINNWMKTLMDRNPDFEQEQKEYWLKMFNGYCCDLEGEKYFNLKYLCPQFKEMNAYLSKINAAERDNGVKDNIRTIVNKKIDTKALIEAIDKQLLRLVQQYDGEEEEKLRDEEQYLTFVKELNGDEEEARRLINSIKAQRVDQNVSFVARLSEAISNPKAPDSAKKTAVLLLRNYINSAFEEFVSVDKEAYPEEIDLILKEKCSAQLSDVYYKNNPNGIKAIEWQAKTVNAENREELVKSLEQKYDQTRDEALSKISDEKATKLKKAGIISMCCVVGVVLIFGIVLFAKGKGELKKNALDRHNIKEYFDKRKASNVKILNNALDARLEANTIVANFDETRKTEGAVVSTL
ncbi:MAG: hypothetical protein MJ216_00855 [Bacilli bacterium]|nr:hypothetical protein [Bacilli bacterium]